MLLRLQQKPLFALSVALAAGMLWTLPTLVSTRIADDSWAGPERNGSGTEIAWNRQNVGRPLKLSLKHPISVPDALSALRESGIELAELRFAGNGVAGGYISIPGKSVSTQTTMVHSAFRDRFGKPAVVASIAVPERTAVDTVDRLRERLTEPAGVPLKRSDTTKRNTLTMATDSPPGDLGRANDFDTHFPSWWESEVYERDGRAWVEIRITWNEAWGHTPVDVPDDWGLEVGITLHNEELPFDRPMCLTGDASADFAVTTWEAGTIWGANVPERSAPYPDYNLWSDPCGQNGLEIGIGFPRQLQPNTTYELFIQRASGNLGRSVMSGSATIKSNDCDDQDVEPDTNCMALRTNRRPPPGVAGAAVYVNDDRHWTAPGCTLMIDRAIAPLYLANGEFGCNGNG